MDYILRYPLTSADVDFLNETTISWDLHNPSVTDNDSGWCDATTGTRLVTGGDRAVFRNVSQEDFTYLTLRYQDRLKTLHDGLKSIYNIDRL